VHKPVKTKNRKESFCIVIFKLRATSQLNLKEPPSASEVSVKAETLMLLTLGIKARFFP
jgi:hypothetical protein